MFNRRDFLKAAGTAVFGLTCSTSLLDQLEAANDAGRLQLPWAEHDFIFHVLKKHTGEIVCSFEKGLYWTHPAIDKAMIEKWFSFQFKIDYMEWEEELWQDPEHARVRYWPRAQARFEEWEGAVLETFGFP